MIKKLLLVLLGLSLFALTGCGQQDCRSLVSDKLSGAGNMLQYMDKKNEFQSEYVGTGKACSNSEFQEYTNELEDRAMNSIR